MKLYLILELWEVLTTEFTSRDQSTDKATITNCLVCVSSSRLNRGWWADSEKSCHFDIFHRKYLHFLSLFLFFSSNDN